MDTSDLPPLLNSGQRFGQFEIIGQIGSGGMGQVYKARHTTLEEDFAIKILHPEITKNPASIFRLRMEARTAFHLKHPNVLNIEEFNEVDCKFYLRMPLMRGMTVKNETAVSLRQVLTMSGGKLQEGDAAIILHDILSGLAFAHENGVVHRDIKPANILFNGNHALISDFGLVRIVGEDFFRSKIDQTVAVSNLGGASGSASSGSSSLIGTYNYMSPEQKLGAEADERSDVYATGLIALDMLTGRTSFGMKAPSRSVKGLSSEWDEFLAKALEPDAGDRFRNAGEMLEQMPYIKTKPVIMAGRSLPVKKGKKKEKNHTLLIAAVALLAMLGMGSAAFLLFGGKHDAPATIAAAPDPVVVQTPQLIAEPVAVEPQDVVAAETPVVEPPAAPAAPDAPAPTPEPVATVQTSPSQMPHPEYHDTPQPQAVETPEPAAAEVAPSEPVAAEPQSTSETPDAEPQPPAAAATVATAPVAAATPVAAPEPPPVDKTWIEITLPGSATLRMRRIEAGHFPFGSPSEEVGRASTRESTPRNVSIAKAFYIGQYELTQGQYEAIMGRNPSRFRAFNKPVEQISYQSIVKQDGLLDKLNRYLSNNGYGNLRARLPSEEEWEYACRAGAISAYNDGSNLSDASSSGNATSFAIFGKPYGISASVGTLAPNAWGLYDMHGNVEEITMNGVIRGGSWASPARDCRCAARRNIGPTFRGDEKTGVRIVIEEISNTPAAGPAASSQ